MARGMRVTGSELVGLVPLKSLTDAGRFFLHRQQRSSGVSEKELVNIAVKTLGLNELSPFNPEERVIEYLLRDKQEERLVRMTLSDFADETASESPAPGGGTIAAYLGALGASLGTMVANLSSHKKGWDERWMEFSTWAEQGQKLKKELLALADEDTRAFNTILEAFGLPKGSETEKAVRLDAIEQATRYAIDVPFRVMKASLESMPLLHAMAANGNPNSVSDAGVGALCARSAVMGAYLNVRINASGLRDREYTSQLLEEALKIRKNAIEWEAKILAITEQKMA
jgi:glutamate formiminotransferase/formiminotetrahydrofolate cyclodeaminase